MDQQHPLTRFYMKNLTNFTPRSEAILQSMQIQDLQTLSFRYIFTVRGMVDISHMIEDFVITTPNAAQMHVSFQYFSRFTDQEKRYRKVAAASNGLWLYGVPDAPLPSLPNLTAIDTSGTALERYWFVVAYGPGIHMCLLAEEIGAERRLEGEPRQYEGFYTFDPDMTYKVLVLLHNLYPEQVPEPTLPELFE